MDDELRKNLLLLKSWKAHLSLASFCWKEAKRYNDLLEKIEKHGCDLSEFKISQSELEPQFAGGAPGDERYTEPLIETSDVSKKLDAAIEYLNVIYRSSATNQPEGVAAAKRICNRLGEVASQLRSRGRKRTPLILEDEYDVQYLLHALLKVHFDDVRPEERTPSFAGSSTSADFSIPDTKVVIEVKFVRDSKDTKRIGNEILEDIPHYEKHPDCEQMFVLIYDPNKALNNPVGLVKDLEQQTFKGNQIQVFVAG